MINQRIFSYIVNKFTQKTQNVHQFETVRFGGESYDYILQI